MGTIPTFFLSLAFSLVAVGIGSLVWPKLTANPRPEPLENVYDIVSKTSLGREIENVLGVTDQQETPVNIGSVAATLAGSAAHALEEKAQSIVVSQALMQIANQFDNLPEDQKEQIQEALCKP
ncbi:MAG: hypothetical protein Q7S76_00855 [bacterium]|nr:hypothetical protein [bacterium]